MPDLIHHDAVDHSEARSALLDALCRCGGFEVRMTRLATGDYLIDDDVLIERKSVADFAASLVDGRLFPQVARLACSRTRSLLLIEGPTPTSIPDVHPHSLEGALVSIATMWRLQCCIHPIRNNRRACCGSLPIRCADRRSQFCGDSTGNRNVAPTPPSAPRGPSPRRRDCNTGRPGLQTIQRKPME